MRGLEPNGIFGPRRDASVPSRAKKIYYMLTRTVYKDSSVSLKFTVSKVEDIVADLVSEVHFTATTNCSLGLVSPIFCGHLCAYVFPRAILLSVVKAALGRE